jgi:hypothetical protein
VWAARAHAAGRGASGRGLIAGQRVAQVGVIRTKPSFVLRPNWYGISGELYAISGLLGLLLFDQAQPEVAGDQLEERLGAHRLGQ